MTKREPMLIECANKRLTNHLGKGGDKASESQNHSILISGIATLLHVIKTKPC